MGLVDCQDTRWLSRGERAWWHGCVLYVIWVCVYVFYACADQCSSGHIEVLINFLGHGRVRITEIRLTLGTHLASPLTEGMSRVFLWMGEWKGEGKRILTD